MELPTTPLPGVAVRRASGPVGEELHLLVRPVRPSAPASLQAREAWESLVATLEAEGLDATDLFSETIFVRPDAEVAAAAMAARRDVVPGASASPTLIGQAPLSTGRPALELAATALRPRDRAAGAGTARSGSSCPCPACAAGWDARVAPFGSRRLFHSGSIRGRRAGGDPVAEAFDMFVEGEELLAAAGLGFGDVVRTWIQLRDIDRDYDALNQARRDFFGSRGIDRRPASTGVQGIPMAPGHDFSLTLFAASDAARSDVPPMTTPLLNEAWTYGADFSRGLRFADDNKVSLLVSGTASIDESGRSLHDGDLEAQATRMLDNISTLLAEQGAGFEDIVSAVTYVKQPSDAAALERILEDRGFGGFPLALVEAPLCRPELLCETEAVAVLPVAAGQARRKGSSNG